MRWLSTLALVGCLLGACGGGSSSAPLIVIDVGQAITADMFNRSVIPVHGAQLVIVYAAVPPAGLPDPLPAIYSVVIPFPDQTPPWTVVNATAPPAGWTDSADGSSYEISTTISPLTAGNQITLIFSYNTNTLQEATQFQSGPIHLFGLGGVPLGTASVLYR